MDQTIYPYTDPDTNEAMVEVHVDLMPVGLRQTMGTKLKIRGMEGISMGGCLSVRYNQKYWDEHYKKEPLPPVGIKCGTDEVNFKVS